MATLTVKHFDALAYVKKAKELGTTEDLAEFQARQIEQAIDVVVSTIENKELSTKHDVELAKLELQKEMEVIRKDIISSRNTIILWVVGVILTSSAIPTILQHLK